MNKLSDVSADELRRVLKDTTEAKAAKRLMVALAYKDGIPVDTLSARYGLSRSTVYSWLDRFENRSVEDAITDEHRPGRPPKLDERQRTELQATLEQSPREVGYDEASWTPERLRGHIESEYGVSYSLGHVRRLLREQSEA